MGKQVTETTYYDQANIRITSEKVELAGEIFPLELIWTVTTTSLLLGLRSRRPFMRGNPKSIQIVLASFLFIVAFVTTFFLLLFFIFRNDNNQLNSAYLLATLVAVCIGAIGEPILLSLLKKIGSFKDVLIVSGTFGEARAFYMSSTECAKCIAGKIMQAMRDQDADYNSRLPLLEGHRPKPRRVALHTKDSQVE